MSRRDYRTEEEFKRDIERATKEEEYYASEWLRTHHNRRHKTDYIVIPWGLQDSDYYPNGDERLYMASRPDKLLCKCYDNKVKSYNKYIVKWIAPLEIQTIRPLLDYGEVWIKKEKIERNYDRITKLITKRDQCILVIMNTLNKRKECYTLFGPFEIERIKQEQVPIPSPDYIFGGKLAYHISINKRRWRDLYNGLPWPQRKIDELEEVKRYA